MNSAQVGDLPLGTVGGPDGHPVARLEAFAQEHVGATGHCLAVLRPRDGRPAGANLEMESLRVPPLLDHPLELGGDRLANRGVADLLRQRAHGANITAPVPRRHGLPVMLKGWSWGRVRLRCSWPTTAASKVSGR